MNKLIERLKDCRDNVRYDVRVLCDAIKALELADQMADAYASLHNASDSPHAAMQKFSMCNAAHNSYRDTTQETSHATKT